MEFLIENKKWFSFPILESVRISFYLFIYYGLGIIVSCITSKLMMFSVGPHGRTSSSQVCIDLDLGYVSNTVVRAWCEVLTTWTFVCSLPAYTSGLLSAVRTCDLVLSRPYEVFAYGIGVGPTFGQVNRLGLIKLFSSPTRAVNTP